MSLQQVNLYHQSLRKQQLRYSFSALMQAVGVTVLLVTAYSAFIFWQLQNSQTQLAGLQQQQNNALQQLQQIQQQFASRQKDLDLQQRVLQLEQELANKQNVVGILSGNEFGNTKGFIGHFTGLARQRLEGLWLTHLDISNGGLNLEIKGTTLQPELLPRYLQRLSAEQAFSGTEFKTLLMARQQAKPEWLDFSLQNKLAEVTR